MFHRRALSWMHNVSTRRSKSHLVIFWVGISAALCSEHEAMAHWSNRFTLVLFLSISFGHEFIYSQLWKKARFLMVSKLMFWFIGQLMNQCVRLYPIHLDAPFSICSRLLHSSDQISTMDVPRNQAVKSCSNLVKKSQKKHVSLWIGQVIFHKSVNWRKSFDISPKRYSTDFLRFLLKIHDLLDIEKLN